MTTPPPSPLSSLSPPSAGERLAMLTDPSAHLPMPPVPPFQTHTETFLAVLPPLAPSLYIPPATERRDMIPEEDMPPRKRSCLFAIGSTHERGESSTARPTEGQSMDYVFADRVDVETRR